MKVSDDTDASNDRVATTESNVWGSTAKLIAYNGSSSAALDTVDPNDDSVDSSRLTNEILPASSDTTSSGSDQVKLPYHVDGQLDTRID